MSLYTRPESKFWWMTIELPTGRRLRESTRILAKGASAAQTRELRRAAEVTYRQRMTEVAKRHAGLAEPQTIRFDKYADWYVDHVTPHKRTAERERSAVRVLRRFFAGDSLTSIDRTRVQEYATWRVKAVAPATVNREIDVLKDMLTRAVPKYLPASPLVGLRRLRSPRRGIRIIGYDEEARIKKAAAAGVNGVTAVEGWALIVTALDTFMRLGDLVRLTPDQYHRTYIHVEDPKIAPYDVSVSARARRALDALRRQAKDPRWVFPTFATRAGARGPENRAIRYFAALCEAAGVPHGRAVRGVTFHALRHTGATRFLAHGGSLRDLMQQGGWTSLESVARYAHPSADLGDRAAGTQQGHRRRPAQRTPR